MPRSPSTTGSTNSTTSLSRSRPQFRRHASWDPPPLFQAYTQAICHAKVCAPHLPITTVLKRDYKRRQSNAEEITWEQQANMLDVTERRRLNRGATMQASHQSASVSLGALSHKLFLLVPTGYLLQYTADGHYDRLPEKILQLGTASVAFASDAVPGKHWVLQTSSDLQIERQPASLPTQGRWSWLTGRSAESQRRVASTLLMVFEDPEELGDWMSLVRREIEGFGGTHYSPEPSHESIFNTPKYQQSPGSLIHENSAPSSKVRSTDDKVIHHCGALTMPQSSTMGLVTGGLAMRSKLSSAGSTAKTLMYHKDSGYSHAAKSLTNPGDGSRIDEGDPAPRKQHKLRQAAAECGSPAHGQVSDEPPTSESDDLCNLPSRSPPLSSTNSPAYDISSKRFSQCSTAATSLAPSTCSESQPVPAPPSVARFDGKVLIERPHAPTYPLPALPLVTGQTTVQNPSQSSDGTADGVDSPPGLAQEPMPVQRSMPTAGYGLFPRSFLPHASLQARARAASAPDRRLPLRAAKKNAAQKQADESNMSAAVIQKRPRARRNISMTLEIAKLEACEIASERTPAATEAHFATCFGTQSPVEENNNNNNNRGTGLEAVNASHTLGVEANASQKNTGGKLIPSRTSSIQSTVPMDTQAPLPNIRPPPTGPLPAVPGSLCASEETRRRVSKEIGGLEHHMELVARRAALAHCKSDYMLSTCWARAV